MPFYHKPRGFTPLLIEAEKKSIKNGLRHAVFTSNFDRYIGEWKNDLKEGKGKDLTCDGYQYEGDWYKGRRHGFGILSRRKENGTFCLLYRGDWVLGKFEGRGWRYFEDGNIYFGYWLNGKMDGYGNMWYTDQGFYVGYFKKGKRNGLGMLVYENGHRYEGNWENDKKHGLGRYYHLHTGQLQEGCWVNDVCVKSKMSDILIRQACDKPTPYPIPAHKLKFSRRILEYHKLWLSQKVGEIDKVLKSCIDQI